MIVQERLYTADDLWEMSNHAGEARRLELVKGAVRDMGDFPALSGRSYLALPAAAFPRAARIRRTRRRPHRNTTYTSSSPITIRPGIVCAKRST